MDARIALELFITGFSVGWGPCLIYCTAILAPYLAGTKAGWKEGLLSSVVFSAGRLIAYMLLGGVVGFSGRLFSSLYMMGNFPVYAQLAGGLFVFLLGLTIIMGKGESISLCKYINKHNNESLFLLGILIGLAPCAPLLGSLVYIMLKSGNFFEGALYGLSFGLGTSLSPILIIGAAAGFLPKKFILNQKLYNWFQRACGVIIIYFAVRLLLPLLIRI